MMSEATMNLDFLSNVFGQQVMAAFSDENVSEIIVNSDGKLILEENEKGKYVAGLANIADIRHAIDIVAQYRRVFLNTENPDISVSLPNDAPFHGARLQALIPPSVPAPSLTIRKHNRKIKALDTFLTQEIITETEYQFLVNAVKNRRNILVSGQPKSGKTTLTTALINQIPIFHPQDRVLILEDVPELQLITEDTEYLQVSTSRSMMNLLRCAMRMRPDRIIVGEVTDGAAHDLLKAWNTGCAGGISTLHANSCRATLQRLVDLSCEKNIPAPITLILESIDVLVHIERGDQYSAGRKVTEIATVHNYDHASQQFTIKPLLGEHK